LWWQRKGNKPLGRGKALMPGGEANKGVNLEKVKKKPKAFPGRSDEKNRLKKRKHNKE